MAGYREFVTGEVLTAANVNGFLMNQAVMVFADDAARTTALSGVLAEGMLTYNLDTQALEVYDGTSFVAVGGAMKEKRIEAFTGSGNWTVPAGVTFAIAHMRGGGAGSGGRTGATGGAVPGANGGLSSVDFASGLVSAAGGIGTRDGASSSSSFTQPGVNAPANSGFAGTGIARPGEGQERTSSGVLQGSTIVVGAEVTPAAVIAVVVGAGGIGGGTTTKGGDGGSGYVYIEYFEEV
jgi:hypothetical protein